MASAVSYDVIIALYIVSLSPAHSDDQRASLSLLRLVSLAAHVGQSPNLDHMEEAFVDSEDHRDGYGPDWKAALDRTLVWQPVNNRRNM